MQKKASNNNKQVLNKKKILQNANKVLVNNTENISKIRMIGMKSISLNPSGPSALANFIANHVPEIVTISQNKGRRIRITFESRKSIWLEEQNGGIVLNLNGSNIKRYYDYAKRIFRREHDTQYENDKREDKMWHDVSREQIIEMINQI